MKKKLKKSNTRPTDTTDYREYNSQSGAVDEAVSGAYRRPDAAELNDEVAEILRENPTLTSFQAHARVGRRGADNLRVAQTQKSDSLAGLADSLTELHAQARRANLNPRQRDILKKASREAELTYLRETRPWTVENHIAKADADGDALVAKAERIKKSDPTLSRFESLRQAARRAP